MICFQSGQVALTLAGTAVAIRPADVMVMSRARLELSINEDELHTRIRPD